MNDRITPAALMVTASLCLITVMAAAATCYRYVVTGELDPTAVAWVAGLAGVVGSLLARTWRESTPAEPTPVTTEESGNVLTEQ